MPSSEVLLLLVRAAFLERERKRIRWFFIVLLVLNFRGFHDPVCCVLFVSLSAEPAILCSIYSLYRFESKTCKRIRPLTVCDNVLFCASVTKQITSRHFCSYDSKPAEFDENNRTFSIFIFKCYHFNLQQVHLFSKVLISLYSHKWNAGEITFLLALSIPSLLAGGQRESVLLSDDLSSTW